MKLLFEWDDNKAKSTLKKHKVSFEEGKTIFNDPFLLTFPDYEHSIKENRFINIGFSAKGRVLVLIHTERGENIRISCRKATSLERREYEKGSI